MTVVEKVENPARRGDLVVVDRCVWRDFQQAQHEYDVMEVTNVFRDGRVKAARALDSAYPQPLSRICGYERHHMVYARLIDKTAAVEAVLAHHWPGHPGLLKSFDSLDEVRDLLKSFKHPEDTAVPRAPQTGRRKRHAA